MIWNHSDSSELMMKNMTDIELPSLFHCCRIRHGWRCILTGSDVGIIVIPFLSLKGIEVRIPIAVSRSMVTMQMNGCFYAGLVFVTNNRRFTISRDQSRPRKTRCCSFSQRRECGSMSPFSTTVRVTPHSISPGTLSGTVNQLSMMMAGRLSSGFPSQASDSIQRMTKAPWA